MSTVVSRSTGIVPAALLALALLLPAAAGAQESHWYDAPVRYGEITLDVLVMRPLAAATVIAGSILFVPAAALSSPGGLDPIQEAWERFVLVPGEQLWERPLGQF